MESRLRKLLSPRRHKARRSDATADVDLYSVLPATAPAPGRFPGLVSQALGKNEALKQRRDDQPTGPLRSFSYKEAAPGKPPQLGDLPQRGNGPVKLQTSRRLSSGELLVTEQDYGRTLQEIREGEYIVGGKERRASKNSSHSKSSAEPAGLRIISTAPSSPRDHTSFPASIWQPRSAFSDGGLVASPDSAAYPFKPPRRSDSAQTQYPDFTGHYANHHGLGVSSPMQSLYPRHMASTTSLLGPHEAPNPAIQALWRAEYSRMVSMYRKDGEDELGRPHLPNASFASRDRSYSFASQPPTHLGQHGPSPPRPRSGLKANASTSNLDVAYRDDQSEWSSHARYSHLSSSGTTSSFTTGTSMADDFSSTREDIRKIVADMRTNYLQAIEAQTPPLQPLPSPTLSNRPRSRKHGTPLMSHASVDGCLRSASQQSAARTKSWQSGSSQYAASQASASSPLIASKRSGSATSRRKSGPAVAGVATLTPIEASPARSAKSGRPKKMEDVGLKRADSTTLGVMARKLTIVDDRKSVMASSKPAYDSSPTFYKSSTSSLDSEPRAPSASEPPSLRVSSSTAKSSSSSVQHTPEKHKPAMTERQLPLPPTKPSWQHEVDRILADDDLDLALDIDDFETLCDGLFNATTATAEDDQPSRLFETWAPRMSPEHGMI